MFLCWGLLAESREQISNFKMPSLLLLVLQPQLRWLTPLLRALVLYSSGFPSTWKYIPISLVVVPFRSQAATLYETSMENLWHIFVFLYFQNRHSRHISDEMNTRFGFPPALHDVQFTLVLHNGCCRSGASVVLKEPSWMDMSEF